MQRHPWFPVLALAPLLLAPLLLVPPVAVAGGGLSSCPTLEECKAVYVIEAGENAGFFGYMASTLRDIDGDGATDFVLGAPANTAGGTRAGRAVVYSGRTGALRYTFTGGENDVMGWAVGDAGDIDGDGTHDIIVGAPGRGPTAPGRAVVYSGSTGAVIRTFTGEAAVDRFGYAVAGAGDVDQDGRDDVMVGAAFSDYSAVDAGQVYLYSGLDGSLIRRLDGEEQPGGAVGTALGNLGDVDGDGIPDQGVGAAGSGPANLGRVYVYSGADGSMLYLLDPEPTGLFYGLFYVSTPGDVDADGVNDLYVGDFGDSDGNGRAYVYSGVDGSTLYEFAGVDAEGLGAGRGAGDVNSDGHADLIFSGYLNSDGAPTAGRVYIHSGKNGALLWTYTSTVEDEELGFDTVGLGDVNGDQKLDFLATAAAGERAYVIAGTKKVKTH